MAASPTPDRGRRDWELAFAFYASLPAGQRSYRAVADEFGLALRTVERHGREGRWRERAGAIDEQARAETDERLAGARAEQLADIEKLISASFVTYAHQLRDGDVQISPSSFATLAKLVLQLAERPAAATAGSAPATPPTTEPRTPERTEAVIAALRACGGLEALGLHTTHDQSTTGTADDDDDPGVETPPRRIDEQADHDPA